MRNSLIPLLEILYISKIDELIIDVYKSMIYKRYIDDIFVEMDNEENINKMFKKYNNFNHYIKFTIETVPN